MSCALPDASHHVPSPSSPHCGLTPGSSSKFLFVSISPSDMSNSLRPHGQYSARCLCPWNPPGKKTGVGCPALLQRIFPAQELNLGLLSCRQILYHLSHQGSPNLSETLEKPFPTPGPLHVLLYLLYLTASGFDTNPHPDLLKAFTSVSSPGKDHLCPPYLKHPHHPFSLYFSILLCCL